MVASTVSTLDVSFLWPGGTRDATTPCIHVTSLRLMLISEFLNRLNGVSKSGGGYVALCPAHDDNQNSLSIRSTAGKILVKCFAGCTAVDIIESLSLTMADLRETTDPPKSGTREKTEFTIAKTYDYRDEMGELLYQVVRLEPKDFRQRRPKGDGWVWKLDDVRRVVYHMPELVDVARVVWVEGEKDVDRLWSLEIPSSTSVAGSNSWRSEYAEQLYRLGVRELLAIPDNDSPGEQYAAKVVTDCARVGIESRVVTLPNLPPRGDVSDWLDMGNTKEALQKLLTPPTIAMPVVSLADAIEEWQRELMAGTQLVVRSPFYGLNTLLGDGFSGGDLIYIGSRPGIGKTAMALAFGKSAALDGYHTLIISREMVTISLARRMVTQESKIPTSVLKRNMLSLEEAEVVERAMLRLKTLPIWITDKVVGIEEIVKLVGGMVKRYGIRFLEIDYLQLVRAPIGIKDRRLGVENVSQALKFLAVEHRIPVVCLSSLVRPEKNSDRPPGLDALRESGELEHDADVVIFLHRNSKDPNGTLTDCIVAKNREGSLGTIELNFAGASLTFTETAAM